MPTRREPERSNTPAGPVDPYQWEEAIKKAADPARFGPKESPPAEAALQVTKDATADAARPGA